MLPSYSSPEHTFPCQRHEGPNEEKLSIGRAKHRRRNTKYWRSVSSLRGITRHSPSSFADYSRYLSAGLVPLCMQLSLVDISQLRYLQNTGVSTKTQLSHNGILGCSPDSDTSTATHCLAQCSLKPYGKKSEPLTLASP